MVPDVTAFDRKRYPILIVDDDEDVIRTFRFAYGDELNVLAATTGETALEILARESIAVLLCDQRLPGMQGAEVIAQATTLRPALIAIALTGFADFHELVKTVNTGRIFRYVPKPWHPQEMRETLERATESAHYQLENIRLHGELAARAERLAEENRFLREQDPRLGSFMSIVGDSQAMQDVRWRAGRVKDVPTTVLLQGATGTGKELIARAIHHDGRRKHRLFVAVNCAALQDGLIESELFGYVRGAFTGAMQDHKGLFQHADGGTLFLDEIGVTSLAFQTKVLRAIEEKAIRPVGGSRDFPVDIRIIAATSRDLEAAVAKGTFLEDLYHRLSVFPIRLPSLAERREDIAPLVAHLLPLLADKIGVPRSALTVGAMAELERRDYHGNVRELANLLERALLMAEPGEPIRAEHLFDRVPAVASPACDLAGGTASDDGKSMGRLKDLVLRHERSILCDELERHAWNKAKVADSLGITPRWLFHLLKRHGLDHSGMAGEEHEQR